jgi:hypothetical protein
MRTSFTSLPLVSLSRFKSFGCCRTHEKVLELSERFLFRAHTLTHALSQLEICVGVFGFDAKKRQVQSVSSSFLFFSFFADSHSERERERHTHLCMFHCNCQFFAFNLLRKRSCTRHCADLHLEFHFRSSILSLIMASPTRAFSFVFSLTLFSIRLLSIHIGLVTASLFSDRKCRQIFLHPFLFFRLFSLLLLSRTKRSLSPSLSVSSFNSVFASLAFESALSSFLFIFVHCNRSIFSQFARFLSASIVAFGRFQTQIFAH